MTGFLLFSFADLIFLGAEYIQWHEIRVQDCLIKVIALHSKTSQQLLLRTCNGFHEKKRERFSSSSPSFYHYITLLEQASNVVAASEWGPYNYRLSVEGMKKGSKKKEK